MKKTVVVILGLSLVLAVFGLVSIMGIDSKSDIIATIGADKAKEIAFTDSGYSEGEAREISTEYGRENGRDIYKVEFEINNLDFDYYIDAYTGAIIERKIPTESTQVQIMANANTLKNGQDAQQNDSQPQQPTVHAQNSTATLTGIISESEAKNAVLIRVPGASDTNFKKFNLDFDDGRYEYEGKLVYNNIEYEFEIDAYSGNFREWDAESIYD